MHARNTRNASKMHGGINWKSFLTSVKR
jgi:hypothetical protein